MQSRGGGHGGLQAERAQVTLAQSTLSSCSPIAILVGAGISTQVENEKALRELICTAERMGSHACSAPPPQDREASETTAKITRSLEPRGGRTPHRTHFMNQGQVSLPSFSVSIRFSERSRNWRYWRSRRFSTCLIWFLAKDRKLQGRREGQRQG